MKACRFVSLLTLLAVASVTTTTACTVDFSHVGTGPDSEVLCGNGVIDPDEECDGDTVAVSCEDLGFDGGQLTCRADCTMNLATCVGCGNSVIDPDEECDHGSLNSDIVPDACRTDCTAARCGDQVADSAETCDGPDLKGSTCASLGYDGGELRCGPGCVPDTSECVSLEGCGNGTVEPGEECDGGNLDGESCISQGFAGGTLACGADCRFDTTGCIQPVGGPCNQDADCETNVCLTESNTGFPGGFCTRDCHHDTCPAPDVCVEMSSVEQRCMPPCTSTAECRTGYLCMGLASVGRSYCYPHCETFNHCPDVQHCNLWNGLCEQPATGLALNGAACLNGGECRSGVCFDPWQGPSTGAMCVSYCNLQTQVCPTGDVCSNFYGGTMVDLGLCLQSCQSPSDCYDPDHWNCVANPWGSGDVCQPGI